MVSDCDITHKVLKSTQSVRPALVPILLDTLPGTFITLQGKVHAAASKGLTGFFSSTALSVYLPIQHTVFQDAFQELDMITQRNRGTPTAWLPVFREFSCRFSCRTLLGHHISEDAVHKVAEDFKIVTSALRLFEIPFSKHVPFTTAWL